MRREAVRAGVCLSFAALLAAAVASAQEPLPPAPDPVPPAQEPAAPPPEPPSPEPGPPPPVEPEPSAPAPPPVEPAPAPSAPVPEAPSDPPPPAPSEPAPPVTAPWPESALSAAPPPVTRSAPPASVAAPQRAPAPSPVVTPAPAPAKKKAPAEDDAPVDPADDSYGLLGPFRIGPVVSGGLPSVVGFGGMVKATRYVGAGLNVGVIPEMTFRYYGEAKVSYQEYLAYAHLHPFGGGFFIGSQIGYARVRGSYATSVDLRAFSAMFPEVPDSLSYTSRATVQTLVLTPELGYFHIFRSGFAAGVDVGLQIPVAPSDVVFERAPISGLPEQVPDSTFAPYDEKVHSTLEKVGRTILPAFHLRLGYLL